MAAKAGRKIPGRPRIVQRLRKRGKSPRKKPRRVNTAKKRKKRSASKKRAKKAAKKRPIAKKRVAKKAAKKRPIAKKRPAPKKRAKKRVAKKRAKKRVSKAHAIIPRGWKRLPAIPFKTLDLERMAAQIAQRIAEKIVGGGHSPGSIEAKILLALAAAEQTGTLSREFYEQAGEYEGYDSPQEVYELWIYSGQ